MESSRDTPESVLSAALRAQAAGGQSGQVEPGPPPAPLVPPGPPPRSRLPVGQVLLFAVVLGVLAGGLAGVLTLA
ncbi:hypothetical protein ACL03H_14665 [Saccharopolyspora sp. MS10]|uniref:hypothetical protein n=1 Tax=Saccharopolyspora sp. MS10 TaxID=3385973 RepID=UPI0039A16CD7